jgi:hypothetical protein
MKRCISVSLAVFIAACVLVGTEKQAWAYIDPGSGLLTLQTVSSAMAACAYFLRRRILTLFSSDKSAQETSQSVPTSDGSHKIA